MSLHLNAEQGQVAPNVLLPGDPLRAKFIAEKYLENVTCYNKVRNMLGYTGTYKGKPVSVQGTGMGIPSCAIYIYELINDYHTKTMIRVGSCGTIQKNIGLKDIILAMSASTDSNFNKQKFNNCDFAPTAGFSLLKDAYEYARLKNIKVDIGNVLSSDLFYSDNEVEDPYKLWRNYGVLAVEMETAVLYTLAAKYNVEALSILTVSDNITSGEHASNEDREQSFNEMIEIALEVI